MTDEAILTRRELEILSLLAEGLSNDEIAGRLIISPNTVKVHLRNIFEKMGVQSRTEATMEAVRRGWIAVPGLDPASPAEPATLAPLPTWPALAPTLGPWQIIGLVMAVTAALVVAFWPNRSLLRPDSLPANFTTDRGAAPAPPAARQEVPRWGQRAAMFTARSRAAAGLVDGRLYVVGGENAAGDSDVAEVYDPAFDSWRQLKPRPVAARAAAAAGLGAALYVVGGCTGEGDGVSALDRVDLYDPAAGAWAPLAPLPGPRCGLALAAHSERLFAIGGWDGDKMSAAVFAYHPLTQRWQALAPLPAPRAFAAVAVLRDRIYVMGGRDDEQQQDEMWVYDPATDVWAAAPALPEPRAGLAAAAEGTSIYAFGGGEGDQPGLHERFDLTTQLWSSIDAPRRGPWRSLAAAMIGPNLHIVGGWAGDFLAAHDAYQASYLQFLPLGAQNATP
jgi:DNA-binding CsgD family transcriptional regulator